MSPAAGPLARANWYGPDGRLIASPPAGGQVRQKLALIRAVNASRARPIAPVLLDHYRLFTALPPVDPARNPPPGIQATDPSASGLNYWQTRYIPSVTGLDGRGLWITPGSHGLCVSDPQAGGCGPVGHRTLTGFVAFTTGSAHDHTIVGLVPDGNRTVTLVLAGGGRRTGRVVDGNVYEATVGASITAVINRDATGRLQRQSLG